jgi:glycosyltransferase involved in cell wall biosynthesis
MYFDSLFILTTFPRNTMAPHSLLLINWRDINNPQAGGAEIYYHELFKRIASWGYRVTLLCHGYKGAPAQETIDGVMVRRIGGASLFNYSAAAFVLNHGAEYDLIIEDLNKLPFFTPLFMRQRPRLHLVMHFFGRSIFRETIWPFALYVLFMERLIPLFYRREHFVAISQSTKDEIVAFNKAPQRVGVVEPGIDTAFFYPAAPKAPAPTLVAISRLKKYKNIQFLIECLPQLRRRVDGVQLVIAGSGEYEAELRRLAKLHGVGDVVRFMGYVDEAAKRELLSAATLFVNPSVKEGWGISTIEANLCGTVALASDVAGLRDSVRDGQTGMLFRFNDKEDFLEKAHTLLTQTQLRQQMEQRARDFALGFDWNTMAQSMKRMLDEYITSTTR